MAFVQIVLTFPFAAYKINDGLVYRLALLGTVPPQAPDGAFSVCAEGVVDSHPPETQILVKEVCHELWDPFRLLC